MPVATRQTIRKTAFASILTLAANLPVTAARPEPQYPGPDREIRLLVRPKASTRFAAPTLDSLDRRFAAKPILRLCPWDAREGTLILRFPRNGRTDRAILDAYRATGAFDLVEIDGIGRGHGSSGTSGSSGISGTLGADPNDQYFIRQYGLKNTGTRTFAGIQGKAAADIKAVEAWDITGGSDSIILAVLDCGLNIGHPDIAARVWVNAGEIPGNGKDDDANGFIDDVNGWSFANDAANESLPGSPDVSDPLGHGTNVSGIIGAIGANGIGVAGVARCRIMPVRVLDHENWGYYSWWAAGIRYAVDNGARVINASLGGSDGNIASLRAAVEYALAHNVTFVASMGNERRALPEYPAAFPGVIAVGATGPDDRWVKSFPWDTTKGSNFGSHISICAPGNIIYGLHYSNAANFDTYWSGTSQAAPHVAGVCALLLAQDPTRKPADLKRLLEAGADDQVGDAALDVPGFDAYYGFGRLNAKRSLMAGMPVTIRPLARSRSDAGREGSGLRALGRDVDGIRDPLGRARFARPWTQRSAVPMFIP